MKRVLYLYFTKNPDGEGNRTTPNYSGYDGKLRRNSIMCHQYFIDDLINWSKSFFISKLNNRLHKYIHAAIYKVNF